MLEAAVVGDSDDDGLTQAEGVRRAEESGQAHDGLADELKQYVKERLAPYKYPRWIEFLDELPKTATGKIQRVVLREREAGLK